MDIGVKALGTVAKRGEKNGAGEADVPVSFGGVTFMPGRCLVADEDGVIVLPEGVAPSDIDTRRRRAWRLFDSHDTRPRTLYRQDRRRAYRASARRPRQPAAVRRSPGAQRIHQPAGVLGAARGAPARCGGRGTRWRSSTTSIRRRPVRTLAIADAAKREAGELPRRELPRVRHRALRHARQAAGHRARRRHRAGLRAARHGRSPPATATRPRTARWARLGSASARREIEHLLATQTLVYTACSDRCASRSTARSARASPPRTW